MRKVRIVPVVLIALAAVACGSSDEENRADPGAGVDANGAGPNGVALGPDQGPVDAAIDRVDHGFGSASVDVGRAEKTLLATFVGRRIGDVASPSR